MSRAAAPEFLIRSEASATCEQRRAGLPGLRCSGQFRRLWALQARQKQVVNWNMASRRIGTRSAVKPSARRKGSWRGNQPISSAPVTVTVDESKSLRASGIGKV